MREPLAAHISPLARETLQALTQAGHTAYLAGGCVRDLLMSRTPKDFDIATSARPDEIIARFPRTNAIGEKFGIIQVIAHDDNVEVATFRRDAAYLDGRHPDSVTFTDEEEDASRRDFTVNGLFYDITQDRVIDYVEGQRDIEARTIRAIGDPEKRFGEDYLRMLRAVRFASTLAFSIDPATYAAIQIQHDHITSISAERIAQELTRLLTASERAGDGLRLLQSSGLLKSILPEIEDMVGQEQPPQFHPEGDVFTHTAMILDMMDSATPTLAYAALLHDVGKPPTATLSQEPDGTERIRFNKHAGVGADMARLIMQRLRMSNELTEDVVHIVRNHMRFGDVQRMKRSTLRQLIGAPTFPTELELHRLDCLCSNGDTGNVTFLEQFVKELENEPVLPDPWATGVDIMQMGVAEGPQVGHWHQVAYEAQLENRFEQRNELLDWLRSEIEEEGS